MAFVYKMFSSSFVLAGIPLIHSYLTSIIDWNEKKYNCIQNKIYKKYNKM